MGADEVRSRVDRLEVLRGQQEAILASCEPGQFASLSREYRLTLAELEELAPASSAEKGTPLDELANRRAGRGATA